MQIVTNLSTDQQSIAKKILPFLIQQQRTNFLRSAKVTRSMQRGLASSFQRGRLATTRFSLLLCRHSTWTLHLKIAKSMFTNQWNERLWFNKQYKGTQRPSEYNWLYDACSIWTIMIKKLNISTLQRSTYWNNVCNTSHAKWKLHDIDVSPPIFLGKRSKNYF